MSSFEFAWDILKARAFDKEGKVIPDPLMQRVEGHPFGVKGKKSATAANPGRITLKRWANKKAAEMMRAQGKPPSGPEWQALARTLLLEGVHPDNTHGLTFPLSREEEGGAMAMDRYPETTPEWFAEGGGADISELAPEAESAMDEPERPPPAAPALPNVPRQATGQGTKQGKLF